jgi:hypothetical protein
MHNNSMTITDRARRIVFGIFEKIGIGIILKKLRKDKLFTIVLCMAAFKIVALL